MRLAKMRVENFKCVEDSNEFTVDQVTCFIGKNEAGKTALLEALYKLNPVEKDKADFDEEEYPRRHLSTYRERQEKEPDRVLTATWELEEADLASLEQSVGQDGLRSQQVVVTKGYDNKRYWTVELDEAKIVMQLVSRANMNAVEKAQLTKAKTVTELAAVLESLDQPSGKHQALLQHITENFPDHKASAAVNQVLAKRLPHFVFFSSYHHLPGRVGLEELKQKKAHNNLEFEDKIFLALLEMTSTSLEEIEGMQQLEKLIMELESVEASLTDEMKKYWSQNRHLEVRFRYDQAKASDPPPLNEGFVFNTRIYNTRHRATVNFEERSHGFIWFFSFLVWFSQVKKEYGDNVILLLDEPGLPLHGRAQQDLVKYINERLKPNHQVIYTAHSPFLIDVENIFSLRTVEDTVNVTEKDGERIEEILGTKVGVEVLSRDTDTLFPLQGVLGFDIAQTLFVGPYVVVVEGPCEHTLFKWFSRQLVKNGREGLDLRWAVCPAEGASKISSFVTLFRGRGLRIAVFADYHQGQKQMIDRLEKSGLLEPKHLLHTSTYVGNDESDIEDVVGRELYVALVNGSMKLLDPHKLPSSRPEGADERAVKEVEAHCGVLPPGFPEFNHYRPIQYLLELGDEEINKLPGLEEAVGRFEQIFKDLNLLIPSA